MAGSAREGCIQCSTHIGQTVRRDREPRESDSPRQAVAGLEVGGAKDPTNSNILNKGCRR